MLLYLIPYSIAGVIFFCLWIGWMLQSGRFSSTHRYWFVLAVLLAGPLMWAISLAALIESLTHAKK